MSRYQCSHGGGQTAGSPDQVLRPGEDEFRRVWANTPEFTANRAAYCLRGFRVFGPAVDRARQRVVGLVT